MTCRLPTFALVACALILVIGQQAVAAAPARPRNVLFIVADDLNTMLGCYGDALAKTPHLDRLAARGVRFDRAYCTFPLCGPSRNSFLTGLHPNATGILANAQVFRQTIPGHPSLPELFRRQGGFAARVGKLYHYNVPASIGTAGHDDPASWEAAFNPAGVDHLAEEPRIFSLKPGQFGATLSWLASPAPDAEHTDGMVATRAEQVLEECAADRSRPFFLGVGFFRPHTPYVAPRSYFDLHPEGDMPVVDGIEQDRADIPAAALESGHREQDTMTDDLRRQARQAYAASISFVDAQVGRVVAALDRLGLADDTVVVFTSDHGYHMGEHGLWQKRSLFEESCRVPLLIVWPGVSRTGGVARAPVSHVDLYPTLASGCGLVPPAGLPGQDLAAMLADPDQPGRDWALTQVTRPGGKKEGTPPFAGYSLRTPRWRYTEWDDGRRGRELYDHEADHRELTNLADDPGHADNVAALSRQLRAAVAQTLPASGTTPPLRPETWGPVLLADGSAAPQTQPPFLTSARVAVIGDSITEQKLYSKYLECWLLACSGVPDVQVMQFGWSGEKADGFARRAAHDLAVFRPTVATLCYGMNDGGYQPWKPEIGEAYEAAMGKVLDRLRDAGVETVVVGSPGAVDHNFFRPGQTLGDRPASVAYNDTLAHLRDIDGRLAAARGLRFADVHAAMIDAMRKANESRGPTYDVCGSDGFHPGPNGQLLMAYAFLKGLGVDGGIGTIAVDLHDGTAVGTPGQAVSSREGYRAATPRSPLTLDVESRRWPFCFEGDGTSSASTRSILPFVPFNADLNRYLLKVANLGARQAKVTWAGESREFTSAQLAEGVNLAAEFSRTPFDEPFAALSAAVGEKQAYETFMIKQVVTDFRQIPGIGDDTEARAAATLLGERLMRRWRQLEGRARDHLVPVRHTITIEPLLD